MSNRIQLRTYVSRLNFRFPFRIAHGERTGTDVVFIILSMGDEYAFGEATLPPYLPDTIESTLEFFAIPEIDEIAWPFDPTKISKELNSKYGGAFPAKAALDMALWNLSAKIQKRSLREILNINSEIFIPHTYTIGVGTTEEMKVKYDFAKSNGFDFFKLKLDGENDGRIITDFTSLSKDPFAVDANQAWNDFDDAISVSKWIQNFNCVLIEQPFDRTDTEYSKSLMNVLDLPIIADEACQTVADLVRIGNSFSGINIKLQKCGGISPAMEMIAEAQKRNLKILMGCMSESSVGCNAAEALTPLCDWADLDGPYLNSNDIELMAELDQIAQSK